MRERQLTKSRPDPTRAPQEMVLGVGMWPGRKRPVLYIGNEFCATPVLSFPNEETAEMFMDFLVGFTEARKAEPEVLV